MIVECDPPRNALLLHFGSRIQPEGLERHVSSFDGGKVDLAVNPHTTPPTLVAILFPRGQFLLPFVRGGRLSELGFGFSSSIHEGRYAFDVGPRRRDAIEWQAHPGLTVFLKERPGRARLEVARIEVDLEVLEVDIEPVEFVCSFASDSLKDGSSTLLVKG